MDWCLLWDSVGINAVGSSLKKKINIYFFSEAATFPSPANLFLELTNQQRRIRYRLGGPRHTRKGHCDI